MQKRIFSFLFPFGCFVISFIVFFITSSHSLGFADAGEFALLTKTGSIAHAPGFPAYIISGWLWGKFFSIFSANHIFNLVLFSITCTSLAVVFLYFTVLLILQKTIFPLQQTAFKTCCIAAICALSFCTGTTVWFWANSIEVYAFHLFSMSLLLYGLVRFNFERKYKNIIIAAIGLFSGLSNHHLTIIAFIPFILFFWGRNLFVATVPVKLYDGNKHVSRQKKKKTSESHKTLPSSPAYFLQKLKTIIFSGYFIAFCGITFSGVLFFYGWMYFRSALDFSFEFGNPDTLSRLFYHLAGGAWIDNTKQSVEGIVAMRFPYFLKLIFYQYFFFLPFLLLGIVYLLQKRLFRLLFVITGYFLLLFVYQLRIDQTADTDAYLLLPFYTAIILVAYGTLYFIRYFKIFVCVLLLMMGIQVILNFQQVNKKNYNVSETLMNEIDKSAPPNSVIFIADWTTVIQYYYFRIAEKFRPDLVVLNYDLKFTNYKILPVLYPEFYEVIKPEYDHFVNTLETFHPQEKYNTGCTLNTPELLNAYTKIIQKIYKHATTENKTVLLDPKTFVFMSSQKIISAQSSVSGCFVANRNTGMGNDFIYLRYAWLNTKVLLNDPAATDKIVDLEAMLDFHKNYYSQTYEKEKQEAATQSWIRIKNLEKKLHKNMPFVYRQK